MTEPTNTPLATVRQVDGQVVLDDPTALAVARAVGKHNCRGTAEQQADRIAHFVRRIHERNSPTTDVLIVIANMDDSVGGDVGEALMPGHDWQSYRARGEVPFARGLAVRHGLEWLVEGLDPEAGEKLRRLGLAVVVFDHGTVEVFEASSIEPRSK